MTNKRVRQQSILELIAKREVGSQEELRQLLGARGVHVTQSTLSRDLHELRLARVPTGDGLRYAVTDGRGSTEEETRTALDTLLPALFSRIDGVGELLVMHTVVGGAQPVAAALDGEHWSDILGTIAGDDTILIVCRSSGARERIGRRLRNLAAG